MFDDCFFSVSKIKLSKSNFDDTFPFPENDMALCVVTCSWCHLLKYIPGLIANPYRCAMEDEDDGLVLLMFATFSPGFLVQNSSSRLREWRRQRDMKTDQNGCFNLGERGGTKFRQWSWYKACFFSFFPNHTYPIKTFAERKNRQAGCKLTKSLEKVAEF